jgi:heme/copper-type cytochrome/quinol oxidase subunit 3
MRESARLTQSGLATALFLASETVFFLALILAFFYLRAQVDPARLTGGSLLDAPRTAVLSVFLLASSGTYVIAERSHRRGNRRRLQLWLAVTLVLGLIFLAGQALEYRALWRSGFTVESNVFSTQFYTMTGIHFLHVAAGAVLLAILCGLALGGRLDEPAPAALQPIGYYWHFVDGVWVVLFTVVYLVGA